MSDANIPALLEELWEVDFETWKDIRFLLLNSMMFSEPREIPLEQHIYHDIIQGCIQRAIAAIRKKDFLADCFFDIEMLDISLYEARVYDRANILGKVTASTPAAAILAAYIEAVRASK